MNSSEITWKHCDTTPPPEDLKLLLRRNDYMYVGIFKYVDNRKKNESKFYFCVDGQSKENPRRADYWCFIPPTLLGNPNPLMQPIQGNHLKSDQPQTAKPPKTPLSEQATKTLQNLKEQIQEVSQEAPQISPPPIFDKAGFEIDPDTGLPSDIKEGTEAFQLMLYDNWTVDQVRQSRAEGKLGYD